MALRDRFASPAPRGGPRARAGRGAAPAPRLPAFAEEAPRRLPEAVTRSTETPGARVAVFAGGCFWGVQGVFQHVRGVREAVSGYAGGAAADADYKAVSARRHRPCRGGVGDLRPGRDPLRRAPADLLLGGARPDAGGPAGARCRAAVPLGAVPAGCRAGAGGAGLHRPARRGQRLRASPSPPGSSPARPSTRRKPTTRTSWPCTPATPTSPPTTRRSSTR